MTLKEYLRKIAGELNIEYDEDKAIEFIEDKARKIAVDHCAAVSDETVTLWFKEYFNNHKKDEQLKNNIVSEIKNERIKEDEVKQISLFDV